MTPTATPLTRAELEQLRAERGLPPYNQALIYQPRPLAGPDWSPEQVKKSRGRATEARKRARHRARWQPKATINSSSRKRGAP